LNAKNIKHKNIAYGKKQINDKCKEEDRLSMGNIGLVDMAAMMKKSFSEKQKVVYIVLNAKKNKE